MCHHCNTSKGAKGEEYNQRQAYACMVYQALKENPDYEKILIDYGDEHKDEQAVLDAIDEIAKKKDEKPGT